MARHLHLFYKLNICIPIYISQVDMQRARSQIDTQRVLATKNTEIAKLQQTIKEQSDLITQYTSQVPSTKYVSLSLCLSVY